MGRSPSLKGLVTKRDGQIDRLKQAVARRDERIANLNQAVAKRDVMLHAMRSSTSWRVTAPLRFVKARASSLHPLREAAKSWSSSTGDDYVYRALPVSVGRKVKLKRWLFSALPFLFSTLGCLPEMARLGRAAASADTCGLPIRRETAPACSSCDRIAHDTGRRPCASISDDLLRVRAQGDPGGSLTYVPLAADSLDADRLDVKLIAFYLPQFHAIPENDRWWGKGFTEWTNVSKAVPQFVGHYQPRLPGELGFYDLRVPDVQRRQIELAKTYGIYGFCYHHYWFAGRTAARRRPFNQVLASPRPQTAILSLLGK